MDKRTLLAFVLIGLIIISWGRIYQRFFHTEEQRKTLESQKIATARHQDEPPSSVAQHSPIVTPRRETFAPVETQEFVPRSIPFENDLLHGEISTKGGVIVDLRLKNFYRAVDSKVGRIEAVSLIPPGAEGFTLSFDEGNGMVDASELQFLPAKEGLYQEGQITFVAHFGGERRIEKQFTIERDKCLLGTTIRLVGFNPNTKVKVGWTGGIAGNEPNQKEDLRYTKVCTYMGQELEKFDSHKANTRRQLNKNLLSGKLGWVGVRSKYFLISLIPADGREGEVTIWGEEGESSKTYDFFFQSSLVGDQVENSLYLGPIEYPRLKQYEIGMEKIMDWGWPIIRSFAKLFFWIFLYLHRVIPNYGVVLIIFSILIKLVVYPLTKKSYVATARMQQLQPQIAALQAKHKNDRQKVSAETMKLYKEQHVNPAGGCLPMLLQMPIFFALFNLLRTTIELRQAGFVFWLQDLSQPDPYYVLPLLMGATMFIQQKMTMKDPKQKAMVYLMPAFLTFMFLKFASGLVLYWTMFNILSALQQWLIERKKQDNTAEVLAVSSSPKPRKRS
jgi:YidC/Oxa1 family membrane protein insertase